MSRQRIKQLLKFLADDPQDSFTLFALAMEYAGAGENEKSLRHFDRLLEIHPDYAAAYYHKGRLLLRLGRRQEAKACLQAGIPAAIKANELHTRDKLQEALDLLDNQPDN